MHGARAVGLSDGTRPWAERHRPTMTTSTFEIQADTGKKVTISGISRLILQVSRIRAKEMVFPLF